MSCCNSRYTVKGKGKFPLDMLRYDSSYPITQKDVSAMMVARGELDMEGVEIERYVTLESTLYGSTEHVKTLFGTGRPCEDRWRSFGWVVVSKKLMEI